MDVPEIIIKHKGCRKVFDCGGSSDLEVRCVDGTVECRREVLTVFSRHFTKIKPEVSAIRLSDVRVQEFAVFKSFYQIGECALRRKDLEAVLQNAKKLGFEEIEAEIEEILQSEVPGIFTIEGVNHAKTSHEDDDGERGWRDFKEEGKKGEAHQSAVHCISLDSTSSESEDGERADLDDGEEIKQEGAEDLDEIPGLTWGSISCLRNEEQPSDEAMQEDSQAEAEGLQDDFQYIIPSRLAIPLRGGESSKRYKIVQRGATAKWSKEETDALLELWPRFLARDGRRDLVGLASAMQARGFTRGTEQVRQKLNRLIREQGLKVEEFVIGI